MLSASASQPDRTIDALATRSAGCAVRAWVTGAAWKAALIHPAYVPIVDDVQPTAMTDPSQERPSTA